MKVKTALTCDYFLSIINRQVRLKKLREFQLLKKSNNGSINLINFDLLS